MPGAPQSIPGAPTAASAPCWSPWQPPDPGPGAGKVQGGCPSPCPSWQGSQGRACTPQGCHSTGGPYSQLALGAPQVPVVQRCRLFQESRSNPSRETRGP